MGKLAKLSPAESFKIWGGNKLSKIKNITNETPLGETWEISTHPDGNSTLGGLPLSNLCQLSYLFKLIDTNDHLSIQVHPGDEYASLHENQKGKTECWIILDAEPGAGIYLGLKPGITKKEFKTAVENNLEVNKYLNFIEVKPGDFFYVPFGSLHALGSGLTLAEVQQSSGVTYRVWDWNRVGTDGKPRELHIDKAMDVSNFNEDFNSKLLADAKNLFEQDGIQKVVEHEEFKADILTLSAGESKELRLENKEGVCLLEGAVSFDDEAYSKYESGICLDAGIVQIKASKRSRLLLIRE